MIRSNYARDQLCLILWEEDEFLIWAGESRTVPGCENSQQSSIMREGNTSSCNKSLQWGTEILCRYQQRDLQMPDLYRCVLTNIVASHSRLETTGS
jgi:hypothetical protein